MIQLRAEDEGRDGWVLCFRIKFVIELFLRKYNGMDVLRYFTLQVIEQYFCYEKKWKLLLHPSIISSQHHRRRNASFISYLSLCITPLAVVWRINIMFNCIARDKHG